MMPVWQEDRKVYSIYDGQDVSLRQESTSLRQEKKSNRGLAFSPMLARAMPKKMAKVTRPKMFDPFVHSPNKTK